MQSGVKSFFKTSKHVNMELMEKEVNEMKKQRLSFDMSVEDHRYLKMCCAKLGISIKDFIIQATNEKVADYEDKWLWDQVEENQEGESHLLIDDKGNFHDV